MERVTWTRVTRGVTDCQRHRHRHTACARSSERASAATAAAVRVPIARLGKGNVHDVRYVQ